MEQYISELSDLVRDGMVADAAIMTGQSSSGNDRLMTGPEWEETMLLDSSNLPTDRSKMIVLINGGFVFFYKKNKSSVRRIAAMTREAFCRAPIPAVSIKDLLSHLDYAALQRHMSGVTLKWRTEIEAALLPYISR